ncbi:hypothetical protein ATP06_0216660 [Amycolatopsis regifaucium]|nr:hypothetical protein ATP06_0216660 [Amycolatopsis regifaucium]
MIASNSVRTQTGSRQISSTKPACRVFGSRPAGRGTLVPYISITSRGVFTRFLTDTFLIAITVDCVKSVSKKI